MSITNFGPVNKNPADCSLVGVSVAVARHFTLDLRIARCERLSLRREFSAKLLSVRDSVATSPYSASVPDIRLLLPPLEAPVKAEAVVKRRLVLRLYSYCLPLITTTKVAFSVPVSASTQWASRKSGSFKVRLGSVSRFHPKCKCCDFLESRRSWSCYTMTPPRVFDAAASPSSTSTLYQG